MDDFTSAYIECALWSTNNKSDPSGGEPLDTHYGKKNIHPSTLADMVADCKYFQEENSDDIATWDGDTTCDEQAGHDFWLNRNGHGCGFWDGDWPEESGGRLDKAAEAYGDYNLYVGGDGRIYG